MRRNTREIKVWMLRNGLRLIDIANASGVRLSYAGKTIRGTRQSREVLQWLLDNGCPGKYLALPKDMQQRKDA